MISLSNLLKQCFVINQENEKRVINADARYKLKSTPVNNQGNTVEEENQVPGSEEILDGFLAGLEAEKVTVEPQITPEELLEQARIEAESVVASAKAEAIKLVDDAKREAELICEQRKIEGYNEGVSKMNAELESEKTRIQKELIEMKQRLQMEHDEKLKTMESDIVDAVITVFNRVFDIQFEDKKQILLHLINNTLMSVEVGKEFHIRVSTTNYKFIESRIGDIKEKIGNDVNIEIVNDMSLGPDDCIIETDSGIFNCGIDMELANLEKDIRSLCS